MPLPQDKTQQDTYTWKKADTPLKTAMVRVRVREDRWFERCVEEAIHFKLKTPSLNHGGGLGHFQSPTYNAILHSLGNIPNILTVWRDLMTSHLVTQQTVNHPIHLHANGPKNC